jgi:hypothetical protein
VCSVSRALVLAAGENSIPSYGLDSPPKDFLLFAQDFLGPWSSFKIFLGLGLRSVNLWNIVSTQPVLLFDFLFSVSRFLLARTGALLGSVSGQI